MKKSRRDSRPAAGLRFFLINDRKNVVNEVFISPRLLYGAGIGIMVLLLTLGIVTVSHLSNAQYSLKVSSLKNQNAELVNILEDMQVRLDEAEHQLGSLVDKDEALRVYADLPPIDADIRALGTGGTVTEINRDYDDLIPDAKVPFTSLVGKLSALSREINLQRNSYEHIYEKLNKDIARLRFTPSIPPVTKGYLTSPFGTRPDPWTGEIRPHHGQDFGVLSGTLVYATADGVVKAMQGRTGYGKTIVIDHGYGIKTFYAHLHKYMVRPGDTVKRGQIIALSGNTGRSTGPHLHYEVRIHNVPVNPRHYFLTGKLEL